MILKAFEEARVGMMFLTRLPMGRVARPVAMADAAWVWPLAGAVLGAIFGLSHWAVTALGYPAPIATLMAMTLALLAGGGLHEDGLADLADGIGGGSDPARRLAIMRDSRLGSYGAMALILAFGLHFALWQLQDPAEILPVAIAMGAMSRMALPLWLMIFPPARREGLGHAAGRALGLGRVVMALVLGLAFGFALISPLKALAAFGFCLAIQLGLCIHARARLGGVTGDVMGAAQVLGALAALFALGGL